MLSGPAWRRRLAVALAAGLLLAGLGAPGARPVTAAPTSASSNTGAFFFPPYPSAADRIGVAGSVGNYPPALGAGWYQDWGAALVPAHPGAMAYARTIYFRVHTNDCGIGKQPAMLRSQVTADISNAALLNTLSAHPGALWIIGNEPDSIYNCSPIMPALYAELYHEYATLIRAHDPTARVAIGAIVQPSPLRLAYLDRVLSAHQAQFGQPLVTDLWNIHLYAFQEVAGQAGAGVPPGAASSTGWTYTWAQSVDLNVLAANLRAMRQWLADHGERHKPLIITEFGQVIPEELGYVLDDLAFTPEVSRDYLQGAVNYFLSATDPDLGYPADGHRLVQLWAWYTLYDLQFGGDLLTSGGSLTLAGQALAAQAASAFTPYADLYPSPVITPVIPPGSVNPVSLTLTVRLDNLGNTAGGSPVPGVFTQHNAATGALVASTPVTAGQVLTRFSGAQPQLSASWTIAPGAWYTLTFTLDPAHTLTQARRQPQSLAYVVGYIPDLALTGLTGLPPAFLWTAPVTRSISVTVRNAGYLTSPAGTLDFTLRNAAQQVVGSWSAAVGPLAPGATQAVASQVPFLTPGARTLTVAVHPNTGPDLLTTNDMLSVAVFAALQQVRLPVVLRASP